MPNYKIKVEYPDGKDICLVVDDIEMIYTINHYMYHPKTGLRFNSIDIEEIFVDDRE